MKLIIGSRRSPLAQRQSNLVRQMLQAAWPTLDVALKLMDTRGDLNRHDPLPAIGGKGLFTAELETALREKTIDIAVHSLKDLPTEDPPGLTVVAVPPRASSYDMLVSRQAARVEDLPQGAVVGTSSLRRAAQVLAVRPDIQIKDIRGNVETRLRKLDEHHYDAIILAQAGLDRMGYTLPHAYRIPYHIMLPAPGQGALGIEGRHDDNQIATWLQPLQDAPTHAAVTAERTFLAGLGGGCSLPIAALAHIEQNQLTLQGVVARADGQQQVTVQAQGRADNPAEVGQRLAQQALAQGAGTLIT